MAGVVAHARAASPRAMGPIAIGGARHFFSKVRFATLVTEAFGRPGSRTVRYHGSTELIGKGAFASVFGAGDGRCVKVEKVNASMSDAALIRPIAIAAWAGGVGIAPRVHCWIVSRDAGSGDASVVIEMDRIAGGVPLGRWAMSITRTRSDVARMDVRVRAAMARLARCGVRHNDLHVANVVVDEVDKPWIVDFTFAKVYDGSAGGSDDVDVGEIDVVVDNMWRAFELGGPLRYRNHT